MTRTPAMCSAERKARALIDPDGFVGERAYDLGVVMRDACREIADAEAVPARRGTPPVREDVADLAEPRVSRSMPERVWRWGFVERVTTGLYLRWYGHGRESAAFVGAAQVPSSRTRRAVHTA